LGFWGFGDLSLSEVDLRQMNQAIKSVREDFEAIKFNTAVAKLMEWLNYLSDKKTVAKEEYKTMLLLLAPLAPHITEELWEKIGGEFSVHLQTFPDFDEKHLETGEVNIVVQVNGKVRDQFLLSKSVSEEEVMKAAKSSEKVSKFLTGDIRKTIFVPGKLLNIVV
jgi:leucyl-tRNA synthetase